MVDGQRKKYEFVVKNRLISESPCSNHSISIELNFKSTEKGPLTSATIFFQAEKKEFCKGEKPHLKSDNEEETTTLNLNIALGTSIPLILLSCASGIILFLKRRSRRGEETFEDQDDNPVYGIYASDGMDTAEATDTNEVYGGGEEEDEEEAERANQMHDVNPYYE